jgi:hypothetical protein
MEQAPELSVQLAEDEKPPEPVEAQPTVPVGVGPGPVTETLQVVALPTVAGFGEQPTLTEAAACVTLRSNVPSLPSLFESPP